MGNGFLSRSVSFLAACFDLKRDFPIDLVVPVKDKPLFLPNLKTLSEPIV